MKNVKQLLLAGTVCSMLIFSACKDDTVDPAGAGSTKTCKITLATEDDGSTAAYTWDGDLIAKIVESDSDGSVTTYNYNYIAGKLSEIVEDGDGDITTYKIVYDNDKVSRVDVSESGEVYEYYNVKLNTDGTLLMVDQFNKEDMTDVIYASYEYTYADGRLQKLKQTYDSDEDGDLDVDDEFLNYKIKAVDDKINPFYGIPSYFMDFADILSLTKNNMNAATIGDDDLELPFTGVYEYDANNYPTKATMSGFDETTIIDFTYMCD
ncbi:MAG: hypothetical protein ACI9JN_000969 [Bacteroidia bacterium]|jgi:hypothetical protein